MGLKKLKQFSADGTKQSQITDYFGFFGRSPLCKEKLMDNASDDDFETPKKKIALPFPILSDEDETVITVSGKRKKKKKLSTPKYNGNKSLFGKTSPNSSDTIIQLNKPLKSEASSTDEDVLFIGEYKQTEDVISPSSGMSMKKEIQTPKKSHGDAFVANEQVNASDQGSPCKKIKVEKVSEDNSAPSTPHSSKQNVSEISNAFSTPLTTKASSKQKKSSPKTSPKKSKKNVEKQTPKKNVQKQLNRSGVSLKPEEEEKELNIGQMELLKKLFESTLEEKRELLEITDIDVIEKFLKLDVYHQYFLMKLFIYKPLWYNMVKFCTSIKLDQKLSPKEIIAMYEYQKSSSFVHTDITNLSTDELLNMLLLGDLKQILKDFKLDKSIKGNKDDIIENLKKNCNRQTTLTMKKTSEDVLKDAAFKYLGHCIKLKEDVWSSFYKVYVLQTYTNSSYYTDIQNYLKDMGYMKVQYPKYKVDKATPFLSKEQFSRFYKAVEMRKELEAACDSKDNDRIKIICDEAFENLKSIDNAGKWRRNSPNYLHKFSAEYQYINILKTGITKLTKNFDDQKFWLEYLIDNYTTNHAIGSWYKHLAHIHVQHYKKHALAAKIVVDAYEFNKMENIFDHLQIYELDKLAYKLRTTKTYKLCNLYCDKLSALAELPIDCDNFPKNLIKGCTYRSEKPGKRIYSYTDANNEVTYANVETIALKHYSDKEEFEGIHCEGRLIVILFNVLFWDIIYDPDDVPMTFLSELQSAPLDMYSSSFYQHRKDKIELRLKNIARKWSKEKLEDTFRANWTDHLHEKSIADFESLDKSLDEVVTMLHCIDRKVLSNILRRLVTNYRGFRSGLPDLFLWNKELSKYKLVEVKGENDKLQPNQILWIQYLLKIGAQVEICHVSGVGAKNIAT